ncbi:PQQ-like beta-propeller repeat protein [bacterium]|nr:PQQ-like beta-propeller repeat protein [bacterium]
MKEQKLTILFLLLGFFNAALVLAQDWPQWRGPNRDGAIHDFKPPESWPEKLKLVWTVPIGSGISSPVVSSGKAWVHTRKDETEFVTSIDVKSGKILWRKDYAAPFKPNPAAAKMGNGPFATPVLHQNKIYTLGISGILSCFDAHSGDLKWRKSFGKTNTSSMFCGTASSPLVDRKNIIVQIGDDRHGSLIAFDLQTGQEKWKWLSGSVSYASPIITEFEGTRQVLAHTNNAIAGVDAENGKLLWQTTFTESEWGENIVTPLVSGKYLILSNGVQGATAYQITKTDGEWNAKKIWQNTDIGMYMSSPVTNGDYLFGMSPKRKGVFFCLKISTGEVLWTTKGEEGSNASIVQAGDVIFFLTDEANLKVINKNREKYEQIASYTVAKSSTWSQPVIWQNHILIKDSSNLLLWEF